MFMEAIFLRRWPVIFIYQSLAVMISNAVRLLIVLLALPGLSVGQTNVATLFRDDNPVAARFKYKMTPIKNSTTDTTYQSTVLAFKTPAGHWDSLNIKVRGRGNFRRRHCFFPPLRIKLKKTAGKQPFAGNKSLKVVVPCSNSSNGRELILREYLCYKIYNAITPFSFQTRLTDLTMINTSGKRPRTYEVTAFFVEDDDLLASRCHGHAVDMDVHPANLQDTSALRADFFAFLIANTDASATFQHNVKIVRTKAGKFVPVPYDFDMSGLVDAPYATVNADLGIASVRQRLYRGYCRNDDITELVRKEYISKERQVFEVIAHHEALFEPKDFTGIRDYVTEFFDILKDDKKFRQNIVDACRKM